MTETRIDEDTLEITQAHRTTREELNEQKTELTAQLSIVDRRLAILDAE